MSQFSYVSQNLRFECGKRGGKIAEFGSAFLFDFEDDSVEESEHIDLADQPSSDIAALWLHSPHFIHYLFSPPQSQRPFKVAPLCCFWSVRRVLRHAIGCLFCCEQERRHYNDFFLDGGCLRLMHFLRTHVIILQLCLCLLNFQVFGRLYHFLFAQDLRLQQIAVSVIGNVPACARPFLKRQSFRGPFFDGFDLL